MKNKLLTISFTVIIFSFFFLNILTKDLEISTNERRKLQTFPKATTENILDASFFTKFDTYTLDQFVYRDLFRKAKINIENKILKKSDNDGIYIINNHAFKMEYPLIIENVENNNKKINAIYNKYLKGMNVYYSIIPDKNYYNNSTKYLKIDYNKMFNKIHEGLNNYRYIDITNLISLNDYYYSDPHWRQENLEQVVEKILKELNTPYRKLDYRKSIYTNFKGFYSNQLSNTLSEPLICLENSYTENANVYNLEYNKAKSIYSKEKFNGIDPYDIFLNGASSLIEITSKNSITNKELIIFRDSFASSLAPLLVPYYSKITLIDIRYINSDLLENYINFDSQDILFLYSTLIYNSNILK